MLSATHLLRRPDLSSRPGMSLPARYQKVGPNHCPNGVAANWGEVCGTDSNGQDGVVHSASVVRSFAQHCRTLLFARTENGQSSHEQSTTVHDGKILLANACRNRQGDYCWYFEKGTTKTIFVLRPPNDPHDAPAAGAAARTPAVCSSFNTTISYIHTEYYCGRSGVHTVCASGITARHVASTHGGIAPRRRRQDFTIDARSTGIAQ